MMSVAQDAKAKAMIRLLRRYRWEKHDEARREIARAVSVLAEQLVKLPDIDGTLAGPWRGTWPPEPPKPTYSVWREGIVPPPPKDPPT